MTNRTILLKSRPEREPSLETFEFADREIPALADGQLLLKTRFVSVDPYMRGRMRDRKSYVPPFQVGEPISGGIVAEVIESKSGSHSKGDLVMGILPWQEYIVSGTEGLYPVFDQIAPASAALGVLGLTGLTAYFGLLDIGEPKEGETVLVSGAAGAVGIIVGQIAKLKGCRVVGTAGTDEKVDYLVKELGFDAAINYKTTKDIAADLKKACPDGVDIYFDNVGGEISDAAIGLLNPFARIPLCGQIALYNLDKIPVGPRPQAQLLINRVKMQGFIVSDYTKRFMEGIMQLGQWLAEGKIKHRETIVEGFENIPDAFLGLFRGDNIGKAVVKV